MARRTSLRRLRGRRARNIHILIGALAVACAVTVLAVWALLPEPAQRRLTALEEAQLPSWVDSRLIPMGTARSGAPLEDYSGIVIHYVGNPGTTALNNRNYFAQDGTEVCSHFVVGLEGEVIQCLPLWERSVASNQRNRDTISIEVCHPDETGEFDPVTYSSLVRLTAWLCQLGGLDEQDVIRHYDVTGKQCPLYYVQHEEAWRQLQADVADRLENTAA